MENVICTVRAAKEPRKGKLVNSGGVSHLVKEPPPRVSLPYEILKTQAE